MPIRWERLSWTDQAGRSVCAFHWVSVIPWPSSDHARQTPVKVSMITVGMPGRSAAILLLGRGEA